jgi:hypothetical protein
MTSADRNDQIPAKKKLEWVTPKISLMEAEQTGSKPAPGVEASPDDTPFQGPS